MHHREFTRFYVRRSQTKIKSISIIVDSSYMDENWPLIMEVITSKISGQFRYKYSNTYTVPFFLQASYFLSFRYKISYLVKNNLESFHWNYTYLAYFCDFGHNSIKLYVKIDPQNSPLTDKGRTAAQRIDTPPSSLGSFDLSKPSTHPWISSRSES